MEEHSWEDELLQVLRNPSILFAQELSWYESRALPTHVHDNYQLDYFYNGTGRVMIGGIEYSVQAGDLFIIQPNVEHNFTAAREHPMEGISFKFDMRGNGREPVFPHHVSNISLLSLTQQKELEQFLRRACFEANRADEKSMQLASALLSVFFILLLRYIEDSRAFTNSHSEEDAVMRAYEYLKKHYSRQLTLNDLSKVAGLCPQYFCRRFAQIIGLSPVAALTRERMNTAKRLLICTRLSITEIGFRVGYQDTYHFSRRFKEVVGMSPKEYRKINSDKAAPIIGGEIQGEEISTDHDTPIPT